jgi:hypothetical protein
MFNLCRTRKRHLLVAAAMVPGVALAASGCGSSGHSKSGTGTTPTHVGAQTLPSIPVPSSPTTTGSGPSVVLDLNGYQFDVSLAHTGLQELPQFTTDDGSGTDGTPIDAPPGNTLIFGQVIFQNATDRAEPLGVVPLGNLPTDAKSSRLAMGVPISDASAFGIASDEMSTSCSQPGQTSAGNPLPQGYCDLSAVVGAFNPAQTDITQPPQIGSGGAGSITVVAAQNPSGSWVPQSAPLNDVKVFVQPNTTCGCWKPLN